VIVPGIGSGCYEKILEIESWVSTTDMVQEM